MCSPGIAAAEDHEAGVPLTAAEAAGPWTLVEAGQQPICIVTPHPGQVGRLGFTASVGNTCGAALPTGVAGWAPTGDGMALTDNGGKVLIAFNRWSNSLFTRTAPGNDCGCARGTAWGPSSCLLPLGPTGLWSPNSSLRDLIWGRHDQAFHGRPGRLRRRRRIRRRPTRGPASARPDTGARTACAPRAQ